MGKTSSEASISSLVAVIRDTEEMPMWVYQLKSASVIQQVSQTERITYFTHESPFFFIMNRDSVVHSNIFVDKTSSDIVIKGKSSASLVPIDKNYVRIEEGESEWRFSVDTQTNKVNILFKGYANPGGTVEIIYYPAILKNQLWELPYTSLKNLKVQVQNAKYKKTGNELLKSLPIKNSMNQNNCQSG
ncbi:hypothetical protein AADZ91_16660 [Colwelliaceae bacterium 6441]